MEKGKLLFREKSLDRINSPEQLNDYIKVANPSIWIVLAAVVILLVGICTWGIFGSIDSVVRSVAVVKDGQMTCFLSEKDLGEVAVNQIINVEGEQYTITEIDKVPVCAGEVLDSWALHLSGYDQEQWIYKINIETNLDDGVYNADIKTESIHPSFFVLN